MRIYYIILKIVYNFFDILDYIRKFFYKYFGETNNIFIFIKRKILKRLSLILLYLYNQISITKINISKFNKITKYKNINIIELYYLVFILL